MHEGNGSSRVSDYIRHNVLGLVAVFIALGGTSWAAATIGAGDIKPNAVRSKHIKAGQVKASDVDSAQVQRRVAGTCAAGQAIRSVSSTGAVTCEAAGGGAGGSTPVGGDLTGTVDNAQIAANTVGAAEVPDTSPLGGLEINEGGLTVGGDLTGTVANAQIGANTVGAAEVPDTSPLGGSEINEDGLAVGGDLTGTVANAQIGANTVGAAEVPDTSPLGGSEINEGGLAVGGDLTGNVANAQIGPLAVNAAELNTNAIPANGATANDGTTKIAANAIDFDEIAGNAVEGVHVAANALTGSDIDESTLNTEFRLTSDQTVTVGGLTVECSSGIDTFGAPPAEIVVTTSVNDSLVVLSGIVNDNTATPPVRIDSSSDFDPGESVELTIFSSSPTRFDVSYWSPGSPARAISVEGGAWETVSGTGILECDAFGSITG